MNEQQRSPIPNRNDTKTLLSTLKWTSAIGAVSLTLAGWGLLSQAEALNAAKVDQEAPALAAAVEYTAATTAASADQAAAEAKTPAATPASAAAILLPTPTPSPEPTATAAATATVAATPTAVPTATAAPTAAPTRLYTLDVVQWVQNSSGEQWALVRDAAGVLWYIYGPDVERMEYGLEPQYQPQPANVTGQTRGS